MEQEEGEGQRQVGGYGQMGTAAHAQGFEEEKTRGKAAQGRAQGVQRVEQTHADGDLVGAVGGELAEHRQGGSHQGGRQQQDQEGEEGADDGQRHEREGELLVDRRVQGVEQVQGRGNRQGAQADAQFEQGVEFQLVAAGIDETAEQEAAQGQAGHEGAEHRADRVGGVAEDRHEHPGPGDLVDEAGRSGEEKQEVEQRNQEGDARGFHRSSFARVSSSRASCWRSAGSRKSSMRSRKTSRPRSTRMRRSAGDRRGMSRNWAANRSAT